MHTLMYCICGHSLKEHNSKPVVCGSGSNPGYTVIARAVPISCHSCSHQSCSCHKFELDNLIAREMDMWSVNG